jgi:hypothetical protein
VEAVGAAAVLAAKQHRGGTASLDAWTALGALAAVGVALLLRFLWVELVRGGAGRTWSLWVPAIACLLLLGAWALRLERTWSSRLTVSEQVASVCDGVDPAERLRPLPAGFAYRREPPAAERRRLSQVEGDFRSEAIVRDVVSGGRVVAQVTVVPTRNPSVYVRQVVHHSNSTGLSTAMGAVQIPLAGRKWTEMDRFHSYRYMTGVGCHFIDLIAAEDDEAQRIATALSRD